MIYQKRIKETVDGIVSLAKSGMPIRLPLGYLYARRRNVLQVEMDVDRAVLVQSCFRLAEAGYPLRQIHEILDKEGLIPGGIVLGPSGLRKILRNPFYSGRVWQDKKLVAGTHMPLVSVDQFERVQQALASRMRNPGKVTRLEERQSQQT